MGSFARALPSVAALATALGFNSGAVAGRLELLWIDVDGPLGEEDGLAIYRPEIPEEEAANTPSRFRVSVRGPFDAGVSATASLATFDPASGARRDLLDGLRLLPEGDGVLSTPPLTAVADREDKRAPWLRGRAVLARPGDVVEARIRIGTEPERVTRTRVGVDGRRGGDRALFEVAIRSTVLRARTGGPPSVGKDEAGALAVVADQLEVASSVFAQCGIVLRASAPPRIVDPPGPSLVHLGGRLGLPAREGDLVLEVDGQTVGPIRTAKGASPEEIADRVAKALVARGFSVEMRAPPRLPSGVAPTADLLVSGRDGNAAFVSAVRGAGMAAEVGAVDLSDGFDGYGPEQLPAGTVEERALLASLPRAPSALDVVFVNRFSRDAKQGESFLATAGLRAAVVLDARGVARAREAYTLAHELGHVLLDDLGHSDADGAGRTDRLMHSRASSARFGPKRLTDAECRRIRENRAGLLMPLPLPDPERD